MKRFWKVIILVIFICVFFMIYRGALAIVEVGVSSEEILSEKEDIVGERVYDSKVILSDIPYCTLKKPNVLYDSKNENTLYEASKSIFEKIKDEEPEDKSLALVHRLDFDNDKKIQYLLKPLKVVGYCNNYTVVYEYNEDNIDCIIVDYSDTPMDSFCSELITLGYRERVLVDLNNCVLEDGNLYVRGYKYGFENVQDALVSLYFDEDDMELRSASFIESYLALPYSPFRDVSVYLISEDDTYYDFGVLYNGNEEMVVKTLKGGKPYLIYADSFSESVENYINYTEMFTKYDSDGGGVVWRTVY